jgi:virginiamycin B lyase
MPVRHRNRAGRRRGLSRPAVAGLACLALVAVAAPAAAVTTITEIPLPAGEVTPAGVAVDSTGAVWFTELAGGRVGRFAGGRFTGFSVPGGAHSLLGDMVNGPDGARWFTDAARPMIWRISPAGVIQGFPIPPCTGCAYSGGSGTGNIISGPDGALWYARPGNVAIGRISTTGQVHEFPVPGWIGSYPGWIAAGPDGAIWFSVSDGIARMTTSGAFSVAWKGANYPGAVTTGPDGNLWFTVPFSDEVGRLTPAGHGTLFRVATNCSPDHIASGDGSLWVTCGNLSLAYRVSATGALTRITLPPGERLGAIAHAPDGAMWFSDTAHNRLVRITGS